MRLQHQLARVVVGGNLKLGAARRIGPGGPPVAHFRQPCQPPHIPPAARCHAPMQPMNFLRDPGVEPCEFFFFRFEHFFGPFIECRKIAGRLAQLAAFEPEDAGAERAEEGAIVTDHQKCAPKTFEPVLKPSDHPQIKMIGRLVEEQHIGLAGERPGKGQTARLPARQLTRLQRRRQLDLVQRGLGHVCTVRLVFGRQSWRQAREDDIAAGGVGIELRLLAQVDDTRPWLDIAFPGVELDFADQCFHQGGLAGAIAPDQAGPVSAIEENGDVPENRLLSEGNRAVA